MADLNPSKLHEARELAAQVVDAPTDEDVYWGNVAFMRIFVDAVTESATASSLYLISSWLTDRWELKPENRSEVAVLMRDAARELLAVTGDDELDAYVARRKERLG